MHTFLETKSIQGPAGALEIATTMAESARAIAVICHPHPLFGGTMQNKVVTTLERVFRERLCHTLRFNFRGVGQSEGSFDQGEGEALDLLAAVNFIRGQFPSLPLELAGFSFGSYVAAKMANQLDAQLLVSIAPPVLSWDFSAIDPQMPWWIAQGAEDEVVAPDAVYRFAEQHPRQPQLLRMPGGHFFHGLLVELRAELLAALPAL
jgi:uncharacterized protein